jgi:hypothetical protein
MSSTAQHEATIPVEVFVVQSDANGIFHKTIRIARCSVQNDGVVEVVAMPCVDTVDVSPMFLAFCLNGSPCLAHVNLATFMWNLVNARDIQT